MHCVYFRSQVREDVVCLNFTGHSTKSEELVSPDRDGSIIVLRLIVGEDEESFLIC